MNILYLSPLNASNPYLFPLFKKTFSERGDYETTNPFEASICFYDIHSGVTKYDENTFNFILDRGIPIICFDNREWGIMQKEKWFQLGFASVHFIRNMDKREEYPTNCFPIDWPFFPECDFPPTTKEELFSRPYDICFIGTESPSRKTVIDALVNDGRLKINAQFLDHTQRLSHNQWLDEHRKEKCFIGIEGGGMTCERPNQLFSISTMIRVENNQKQRIPIEDGINCIEINCPPTKEDIDKIVDILNDKDWLYDIYRLGVDHTKRNLSGEAIANYILDTMTNEKENNQEIKKGG